MVRVPIEFGVMAGDCQDCENLFWISRYEQVNLLSGRAPENICEIVANILKVVRDCC